MILHVALPGWVTVLDGAPGDPVRDAGHDDVGGRRQSVTRARALCRCG